jgi:DMSO reductase family type II enzyme heme b subunit
VLGDVDPVSSKPRARRKQARPADQSLPRPVIAGTVIAVFAVNLVILGYALWISRPAVEAAPEPPAADRSVSNEEAPRTEVVRVGDERQEEVFAEDEEDDWALEPIQVVNVFDLPSLDETRPLYLRHCAGCHGLEGRGDGPAAEMLLPRPRDFFGSEFRYAAWEPDRQHVLTDLQRTISRGVPRSAMPGFGGVLTETQIGGLALYVLDIRQRGEELAPAAEPLAIGERPPITRELVAQGEELYVALSCNTCHGDTGRGDGMNAAALVDFQGRPVRPADFTSGLFKTGQTPEDLCRTVLRGVPGTPMVAYEAVLAQENEDDEETVNTMDAWAVVAYIRSLAREPAPPGVASGAHVVVGPAADESMLGDPAHPAWLGVEPVPITVSPLQSRPERTTFVEVRAVRAGGRLGLCLDWRDASLNLARGEGVYPDAVGAMFGLSDEVPALPVDVRIAEYGPQEPVNTWYWRADRQLDAVMGKRAGQVAPDGEITEGWYRFVNEQDSRLPELSPGAAAGDADRRPSNRAVLEVNARGLGRITPQAGEGQHTDGAAIWSSGAWRVLMVRPLVTGDDLDAQFTPGGRVPVAFAVWDGAKGDHGGTKLVSSWHWLVLRP